MPPLSGLLVLYKGTKYQISNVLIEVKGFIVNWRCIVFVQIYNKILLTRENYVDAVSIVVNFINRDNGLRVFLKKDAFLLIFRDIFNVSKMAKD